MYYENKHILIYTDESPHEYPPSMYIDFFYRKPTLKHHYKDNSCFNIDLGFFGHYLNFTFRWNFVEREMNEREIKRFLRYNIDSPDCPKDKE